MTLKNNNKELSEEEQRKNLIEDALNIEEYNWRKGKYDNGTAPMAVKDDVEGMNLVLEKMLLENTNHTSDH